MLQGAFELIKRLAFLKGLHRRSDRKADRKTAEEELAEAIQRWLKKRRKPKAKAN